MDGWVGLDLVIALPPKCVLHHANVRLCRAEPMDELDALGVVSSATRAFSVHEIETYFARINALTMSTDDTTASRM